MNGGHQVPSDRELCTVFPNKVTTSLPHNRLPCAANEMSEQRSAQRESTCLL